MTAGGTALPLPTERSIVRGPDALVLQQAVSLHRRAFDTRSWDPFAERWLVGLYRSVLRSDAGFLVVARQGQELRGAILATTDSKRVPPVIMPFPHRWAWLAASAVRGRGAFARSIEDTSGGRLAGAPPAELMAIAVQEGFRSRGIGSGLLDALHEELLAQGVGRYKVFVGATRVDANRFYIRNGFELARKASLRGLEWNVLVRVIQSAANGS